ncbi:MAG TPA: cytochrome c [Candidatus Acidoferrales bacterium]|jgi:mono/diheme cytochrome c family protein|nr:cytochrome c [Verrucomicrobiae bacterium]HZP33514.1 cytochrome c [Candidatus Acidoferrales bacterium]
MKKSAFVVLISLLAGFAFGCKTRKPALAADPVRQAYDSEADWSDPQRIIPLNYDQAQGKRIFYTQCVWCHADATPAGPSNRSNLNPMPAVMNDGTVMNKESDEYLQNIITLGGSALSRSAMMPPYGQVLTQREIQQVIAYARAIAQPPYQPPASPGPKYTAR